MTGEKTAHVSDAKKKIVGELSELIKNKKTILIASIKNLPASQFQEISKKLRSKAIIKVPKKNLIFRAIDSSGNEVVKELKEQISGDIAILFSDLDCFDLAGELINNKSPAKAKAGQEAPEDIEVQAGPTELVPGPAISELGALGIKIQIEKGKVHIKEPKIIAEKGEKISSNASEIMSKLDIKPFSIGFVPLCAFDIPEGKLYSEIKINKEETLEELKTAFGKALPFAVEIGYVCEDTIKVLIGKASMQEKSLEKLEAKESEKKEEEKLIEENKEGETPEKKPEEKPAEENKKEVKTEPVENKESETQPENKSEGEKQ